MARNFNNVILVSPSPVDGYPPVQHQARLLSDAGFVVYLVTSNFKWSSSVTFSHPGVFIISTPLSSDFFLKRQLMRLIYLLKLFIYRVSKRPVCEISYDINGLFYTRLCPFKPKKIISHLHEMLADPKNNFYEKFSIPLLRYSRAVVVADIDRAIHLYKQINLLSLPVVVKNVPLLTNELTLDNKNNKDFFSTVYIGSISENQAIDKIIMSMIYWPKGVKFHLYGSVKKEIKENLLSLAKSLGVDSNIQFEGWIDYSSINNRIKNHDIGFSFYIPSEENHIFSAGASNKRYQYMLAGIPQITDNSPSSQALVEENNIGLAVSPESPEDIAKAVNYLYENADIRIACGNRAKKLIIDKYRYDIEFKPVIDLIKCK